MTGNIASWPCGLATSVRRILATTGWGQHRTAAYRAGRRFRYASDSRSTRHHSSDLRPAIEIAERYHSSADPTIDAADREQLRSGITPGQVYRAMWPRASTG
jgi:hypothetical protein